MDTLAGENILTRRANHRHYCIIAQFSQLLMALPNGPFGTPEFIMPQNHAMVGVALVPRHGGSDPPIHAAFHALHLPLKSGNSPMAFPPGIIKPLIVLLALTLAATGAAAQAARDVAGARDFAGIGRFAGSVITG